jgi:hypothetical protein
MKYYFEDTDSERCYTIDYFREQLNESGLQEMSIYPARIVIGSGFFYCNELQETGESNDKICGKWCDHYKPRNGKNGRCVHHHLPYEPIDKSITIYKKESLK